MSLIAHALKVMTVLQLITCMCHMHMQSSGQSYGQLAIDSMGRELVFVHLWENLCGGRNHCSAAM